MVARLAILWRLLALLAALGGGLALAYQRPLAAELNIGREEGYGNDLPFLNAFYAVEQAGKAPVGSDQFIEAVALENTRQQMRAILERSPIIEHLFDKGHVGIVGGMYSVETGEVEFFDQQFHAAVGADGRPAADRLAVAG